MIKLVNVIDTRTGLFHSVAWVKQRNVKYFIEVQNEGEESNEE